MHPIYWIKDIGVVVAFPERAVAGDPGSSEKRWYALTTSDENGLDETLIGLRAERTAKDGLALIGLLPPSIASADAMRVSVFNFMGFSIAEAKKTTVLLSDLAQNEIDNKDIEKAYNIWLRSGHLGSQPSFLIGAECEKEKDRRVGFGALYIRNEEPQYVVAPFRLEVSAVDAESVRLSGTVLNGVLTITGTMSTQQAARLRLIVVPRRRLKPNAAPLELNLGQLACSVFSADFEMDYNETDSIRLFSASAAVKPRDYVILTSIAEELKLEAKGPLESNGLQLLSDEDGNEMIPARGVFEVGLDVLHSSHQTDETNKPEAELATLRSPDQELPSPYLATAKAADDFAFKAVYGLVRSEAFDTYLRRELAKCAEVYLHRRNLGRIGLSFAREVKWTKDNHAELAPLLAAAESLDKDTAQKLADTQVRPDLSFLMEQCLGPELERQITANRTTPALEFTDVLFRWLWPGYDAAQRLITREDVILLAISVLKVSSFRTLVRDWKLSIFSAIDLAQSWSKKTPEKFEELSNALSLFSSLFPPFPVAESKVISLVKWYESPRKIKQVAPRLSSIFTSAPVEFVTDEAEEILQAAQALKSLPNHRGASENSGLNRLRVTANLRLRHAYSRARKDQAQVLWPNVIGGLGVAFEAANAVLTVPSVGTSQPLQQPIEGKQNE